jgi:hypothetical protein
MISQCVASAVKIQGHFAGNVVVDRNDIDRSQSSADSARRHGLPTVARSGA